MLVVPWEVPCCCSDADLSEWYPEKLMTPENDIRSQTLKEPLIVGTSVCPLTPIDHCAPVVLGCRGSGEQGLV